MNLLLAIPWVLPWTAHNKTSYKRLEREYTLTYRPWDKEAREQIPEAEEKGHNNSRNLVARSKRNNHHPIHREVDEAHEHKVVEPEKLVSFPREADHTEKEQRIDKGLQCYVEHLNAHLQDER